MPVSACEYLYDSPSRGGAAAIACRPSVVEQQHAGRDRPGSRSSRAPRRAASRSPSRPDRRAACAASVCSCAFEERADVAVLDRAAEQVAALEHLLRIEDRAVAQRQHRADRLRQPDFVRRERTPRRHVQDVPRSEPADRQHRRIVGRLDRQASVGRQRRHRLGLERGAAEELPQRRLQQAVVERAGRKDGRKRHGFSDHNSSRMPRRTLIDFFDDLAVDRRRVPRLRRWLSDAGR